MKGCRHVWRKRRTRRVHIGTSENGIEFFTAYPKQCVTCFLSDGAS